MTGAQSEARRRIVTCNVTVNERRIAINDELRFRHFARTTECVETL